MIEADRLQQLLDEHEVDGLLVTAPANVRYISGFTTPSDGRVLIERGGSRLITDGRYDAQAAEESRLPVELRRDWLPWSAGRFAGRRLGVEADSLTLAQARELQSAADVELVPLQGVFAGRRMVKSEEELNYLREAARLTSKAFDHILGFLEPGMKEVDVALELERVMRSGGSEGVSFDLIVASGPRSAMPHGVASQKVIESGELVTFDLGAVIGGYHADMTRTIAVGEPTREHRALYEAVREALDVSVAAVKPGVSGRELDDIARRVLAGHGLEEYFVHSLGHGVGLEIHEGPRLSQSSEDVLRPGMAVTVEPGAYRVGDAGVRIEDLVVVTEDGAEVLSEPTRELIVV